MVAQGRHAYLSPSEGGGVLIRVAVTPKSKKLGLGGVIEKPDGAWLKIHIHEAPEDGKANHALCRFLAKALRVPVSSCQVVKGEKNRQKILHIHGIAPEAALAALKLNA